MNISGSFSSLEGYKQITKEVYNELAGKGGYNLKTTKTYQIPFGDELGEVTKEIFKEFKRTHRDQADFCTRDVKYYVEDLAGFDKIPVELIEHILNFLPCKDYNRSREVCKDFNQVFNLATADNKFNEQTEIIAKENIKQIQSMCKEALQLDPYADPLSNLTIKMDNIGKLVNDESIEGGTFQISFDFRKSTRGARVSSNLNEDLNGLNGTQLMVRLNMLNLINQMANAAVIAADAKFETTLANETRGAITMIAETPLETLLEIGK